MVGRNVINLGEGNLERVLAKHRKFARSRLGIGWRKVDWVRQAGWSVSREET